MAKLCRKLKWLVFFWDTVYIKYAVNADVEDDNDEPFTVYTIYIINII